MSNYEQWFFRYHPIASLSLSMTPYIESLAVVQGKLPLSHYHWQRLQRFCQWQSLNFSITPLLPSIYDAIQNFSYAKLRIALYWTTKTPYVQIRCSAINPCFQEKTLQVCFLKERPPLPFLPFKYLQYHFFKRYLPKTCSFPQALWVYRDRVVETSYANIFYVLNGVLYTIPLSDGCVDGVFRRFLMEHLSISLRSLKLDELAFCETFFITNAVRGIQAVKTIDYGGKIFHYPSCYEVMPVLRVIQQRFLSAQLPLIHQQTTGNSDV